jgi:hypothetical protein
MSDETKKKSLADKRRKYYGGTKNDALYLFRQSRKYSPLSKGKFPLPPNLTLPPTNDRSREAFGADDYW